MPAAAAQAVFTAGAPEPASTVARPPAPGDSSAATPIALGLLGLALLVVLQALLRSLWPRKRIALDDSATSNDGSAAATDAASAGTDADLSLTEDERRLSAAAHGVPIEEDTYRATVRRRMTALALAAVASLVLSTAQAVRAALEQSDWTLHNIESALRVAVWALVLLLLLRRASLPAYPLAVALTASALLAFASEALTLVVASDFTLFPPSPASSLASSPVDVAVRAAGHPLKARAQKHVTLLASSVLSASAAASREGAAASWAWAQLSRVLVLKVLSLLSAFAAFVLAGTIPVGPVLAYRPSARAEPVRMLGLGARGGEGILQGLLYLYMTPVILRASQSQSTAAPGSDADTEAASLKPSDLPYLHAELRAITLYTDVRASWARQRARALAQGRRPAPRHLLIALLATMGRELSAFGSVVWISALLFYLPSLCMNRFVSIFEREAVTGTRDVRTAATWAIAVFVCSAAQNVLLGVLYTATFATLQSKIKQQLNALLFAKTLRRQEISSGAPSHEKKQSAEGGAGDASEPQEADGKKGDEDEHSDDESFHSKAAVMTLVGNDVGRVSGLAQYIITLGLAPIEISVGFAFIFLLLGWGAIVGLASALLLVPVMHRLAKLTGRFQERLMKARDARVTFLNEAIEAIRMIKFSALETNVMDRILSSRRKELKELRKVLYCETANEAITSFSPILVIIVALSWSALVDGRKLTPSVTFTAIAMLNELRFALTELPTLIESLIELWVSLRRIVAYLELPEVQLPLDAQAEAVKEVTLRDATISWPVQAPIEEDSKDKKAKKDKKKGGKTSAAVVPAESSATAATESAASTKPDAFKLQDITTSFEMGKINLICGKVGSGKSMLLLALLGELSIDKGSIISPRSHPHALGGHFTAPDFIRPDEWIRDDLVAYIPQTAWLVNASLRDNITWGLPMDEKRYRDTLAACALLPDLAVLEDGDLTDIGEKGIGLSGGQKTRVCLARCVYSRASLLLLDSPLSNVDAHTASHIHNELLKGPLLEGRTVLLVSHQVAMLAPTASKVVMLEAGRVKYDGSAESFLGSDYYAGLLQDLEEEETAEPAVAEQTADIASSVVSSGAGTPMSSAQSAVTTPATSRPPSIKEIEEGEQAQSKDSGVLREVRKAMSEETTARGAVSWKTYSRWIKAAGGPAYFIPMLLFFLLYGAWDVIASLWLRGLSADAARSTPSHSSLYWLSGYAVLLSSTSIIKAFTYLFLYTVSLRASHKLFADMLTSVFRANLRTHDTIPKGRFINRFSSDMDANDQQLPMSFAAVTTCVLSFAFGILAVIAAGGGGVVFYLLLLGPFIYYTGSLYRMATRNLRRLEAVTKSPIATCFSDLLSGVVVVRAFGSSGRMMSDVLTKSDDSIRCLFFITQATRWMITLFQFSSATMVLTGMFALLFNPHTDAASAGFATAFLSSTDFFIALALLCLSRFEQMAVSTERIIEYQELPQEPPAHVAQGPPASWPSEGSVEIKELSIKYAPELPTILKGITLDIPARAKVGIVGKTGCGKSTLASCFFRFVEPTSGHIKIDGVNISSVGLEDLRSRMTIVPQDPVILSGTLREAIDPFYNYSDEQVRDALRQVRLVPNDPEAAAKCPFADVAYKISEGGSNLSGGERQLICLARALLGSSKLVFFDEASSALDSETDEAIAKTIRESLVNSTVVTIAHRLRTIADFDYILVMDKGQVIEFDKPIKLIDDANSRFHKLAKATGKAEFRELREMALKGSSSH